MNFCLNVLILFVASMLKQILTALSIPSFSMPHRPDLVCSLRFIGEDDILDRLTSDCASNNDEPPKVDCDCCTECYVGGGETLTVPVSDPPTKGPPEESDPPTASPVSGPPTAAPVTPSPPPTLIEVDESTFAPNIYFTVLNQQEGSVSPEEKSDAEQEEKSSAAPEDLVVDETPAEEPSTPGARNELQNGTNRDSNDWYQHVYGEEEGSGQQ